MRSLDGGQAYAAQLKVHHGDYHRSQKTEWRLWTKDALGRSLDGTPATLSLGAADGLSYGVYGEPLAPVVATWAGPLVPTSVSQDRVFVTLSPLLALAPADVRIVSPPGFTW